MKAKDIALLNPPSIEKSQPLSRALKLMEETGAYCVIVRESGIPYGLISYKDILNKVSTARFRKIHVLSIRLSSFFNPITNKVTEDASIADAAALVLNSPSCCCPVYSGEQLIGIVYPKLFLKAVSKSTEVVVAQVMRSIKESSLKTSDRIIHARKILAEQKAFAAPVLTEDGKVFGVLDERDLVKAYVGFLTHVPEKHQKAQINYLLISDVCKKTSHVVYEGDYLNIAAKIMLEEDLSGLPVSNETGDLVGFLGLKEVLNFISLSFK